MSRTRLISSARSGARLSMFGSIWSSEVGPDPLQVGLVQVRCTGVVVTHAPPEILGTLDLHPQPVCGDVDVDAGVADEHLLGDAVLSQRRQVDRVDLAWPQVVGAVG